MMPQTRRSSYRIRALATSPKEEPKLTKKTMSSKSSTVIPLLRIRKPAKEAPELGLHTVLIEVGEIKTRYIAHQSLLASASEYIRAACQWPSCGGTIHLLTDDPELFDIFVKFCYFGRVYSQNATDAIKYDVGEEGLGTMKVSYDKEWNNLMELYMLGDRLQALTFKDAVINAIVEKAGDDVCLPVDQARFIYENTPTNSELRKLVVDFHVYGFKGEALKSGSVAVSPDADAPKDFLQDVLEEFMRAGSDLYSKKKGMPWIENACTYHEHKNSRCKE